MLACWSEAEMRTSSRNMRVKDWLEFRCGNTRLITMGRSNTPPCETRAKKTSAMPPTPRRLRSWYLPNPGISPIACDRRSLSLTGVAARDKSATFDYARSPMWTFVRFSLLLLVLAASGRAAAQPFAPDLWKELKWRSIGPYRGGRTKAAVGIPDQPHVFYVGVCNGGVWKTNDAGRTWQPLFDEQPTGSIGALAIAPSQPNILYVGSGEGLQRPDLSTGDGIYKSTDGGRTWRHLGLRDGQQIPQIIVDPRNPNRLFVAVLGHPY